MRAIGFLSAAGLAAALFSGQATAEHEADHRYVVRGFVLQADDAPLPDVTVSIRLGGQTVARARTDRQGYYSAQAHLHDQDIGKEITVQAGERTTTVRMDATRGDHTTMRVHHVNFVGGSVIEGELGGLHLPAWVYSAAIGATVLVVAAFLAQRVSRARRRARAAAQETPDARPEGRAARRRRKKRRR